MIKTQYTFLISALLMVAVMSNPHSNQYYQTSQMDQSDQEFSTLTLNGEKRNLGLISWIIDVLNGDNNDPSTPITTTTETNTTTNSTNSTSDSNSTTNSTESNYTQEDEGVNPNTVSALQQEESKQKQKKILILAITIPVGTLILVVFIGVIASFLIKKKERKAARLITEQKTSKSSTPDLACDLEQLDQNNLDQYLDQKLETNPNANQNKPGAETPRDSKNPQTEKNDIVSPDDVVLSTPKVEENKEQ